VALSGHRLILEDGGDSAGDSEGSGDAVLEGMDVGCESLEQASMTREQVAQATKRLEIQRKSGRA
jgi:hypothetical protein